MPQREHCVPSTTRVRLTIIWLVRDASHNEYVRCIVSFKCGFWHILQWWKCKWFSISRKLPRYIMLIFSAAYGLGKCLSYCTTQSADTLVWYSVWGLKSINNLSDVFYTPPKKNRKKIASTFWTRVLIRNNFRSLHIVKTGKKENERASRNNVDMFQKMFLNFACMNLFSSTVL